MRRRLVVSYVTVAALLLLALEVPLALVYARHEHDVAGAGVVHDATALASLAEEGVEHRTAVDLGAVASRYRSAVSGDVEIVDRSGSVVVAPRTNDPAMGSPALERAFAAVIRGEPGGVRALPRLDDLVAIEPVGAVTTPSGAVAVSASDEQVDARVHEADLGLVALGLVVLGAVAALGLVVARSVTRPLTHLEAAARKLGGGDLDARAPEGRGPAEMRELSREFNSMASRLEDLVGAQQAFVADASHQLRSPLTALRLRLENLGAARQSTEGDFDAVLTELERLSRVVDGLLTLARSEGRGAERAPIDVATAIAERVEAWSALADEAGVVLRGGPTSRGPLHAWFVPGHLEQVLDNLIANALEASAPGGRVEATARRDGADVEVRVTDHGVGMSPEARLHAFDRFWRGSGVRPGSGSGLGLSIVRQLARESGARVELAETPGGGVDAVLRMEAARSSHRRDQPLVDRA